MMKKIVISVKCNCNIIDEIEDGIEGELVLVNILWIWKMIGVKFGL